MDHQSMTRQPTKGRTMKNMLRLPDVAALLDVHPSTLRRWCEQGDGPRHIRTPGGTYLFEAAEVERWKRSLEPVPADDAA